MNELIHIGSELFLVGCSVYLIFFKDYLKKKGSNLADKEDIAEITRQIEKVKNEFFRENEQLKANLQIVINRQIRQSNEERTAIFDFHDSYCKWLNEGLLDIKVNNFHRNNIDNLIQKDRELNDYYVQTGITHSRLSLVIDDQNIIQIAGTLIVDTLKFNHWTQDILSKLKLNSENDKRNTDLFLIMMESKPTPAANNLAKREKELQEERNTICTNYYLSRNKQFDLIHDTSKLFNALVKDYIKKQRAN